MRIFIPRYTGKEFVVFPTYEPKDLEELTKWQTNTNLRYDLQFKTREECQEQCNQMNNR